MSVIPCKAIVRATAIYGMKISSVIAEVWLPRSLYLFYTEAVFVDSFFQFLSSSSSSAMFKMSPKLERRHLNSTLFYFI